MGPELTEKGGREYRKGKGRQEKKTVNTKTKKKRSTK
jgi:hypothetical protein